MRGPGAGRRWRWGGVLVVVCALNAACERAGTNRTVLDNWLTCVECIDGELDSVVVLAAQRPATIDSLRDDLLNGPSVPRRARLTQQLTATHQRMTIHVAGSPAANFVSTTQTEFVDRYLGKMVALYQTRAARALAEIGGARAGAALDSALSLPANTFDSAVLARIQFVRDSLLVH